VKISVLIKSESRYPVDRRRIRDTVTQYLTSLGVKECEVSLAFVGKRKLQELSRRYLKDSLEHVVLSFPFTEIKAGIPFPDTPENSHILGEVVVCYPQAQGWARAKNTRVDDMIDRLVVYGIGHLVGQSPVWFG